MQEDEPARPGLGGPKRRRLSDEETERRMLETAAGALARSGLTVSLEHVRLEDVIREAGVSRSAAYRKWPHKDAFLGDLLLELARGHALMTATGGQQASDVVRRLLLRDLDKLGSAEHRNRLLVELIRETAYQDFRHIHGASNWRTYLALTVTAVGLPAGELRERVQEALGTAEAALTDGITNSFRVVADLLGLRPRHPRVGFRTIAHLANAMLRGFVMKTLATPELADERVGGSPFDEQDDWSLPALGMASVFTTHLEEDPAVTWDAGRIAALRERLAGQDDLFAASYPQR